VLVRAAVIETIARLARAGTEVPARQVDPAWSAALRAVTPGQLALLADEDPQVRRAALFLAGIGGLDPDQAVARPSPTCASVRHT
jgi:HEAT repeat protein